MLSNSLRSLRHPISPPQKKKQNKKKTKKKTPPFLSLTPSVYRLRAVRHGPIPLGWYVNEKMKEDNGSDWSDQMCRKWHAEDGKHTDWLSALLPCPCTLDQALADFGRFQPDAGCSLFTGSKCTYHKKAKHCVRAVVPT